MGFLNIFRRREETNPTIERHKFLLDHGRITDGRIIDNETDDHGREIVYYLYTLNGVDFESSEILSIEQMQDPLQYAPGAKVAVRYDPRNQGNSMLV
ncbi:MAG: DUF3592 domain-containing protein [Acidobacteriota bacterium]